jgi:glycosyltransferase involved in cell wall biosynthesis
VPLFSRADLPLLLAEHDAGLFTSRAEGWGLVLNEMIESGLPVYATRAGGVDALRSVLGSFVQEFPPPPGAIPPLQPDPGTRGRYEARFRWLTIAERYLEAIVSARRA